MAKSCSSVYMASWALSELGYKLSGMIQYSPSARDTIKQANLACRRRRSVEMTANWFLSHYESLKLKPYIFTRHDKARFVRKRFLHSRQLISYTKMTIVTEITVTELRQFVLLLVIVQIRDEK